MADCYNARELEDAVHRLLPPEILADIGIVEVDAAPPSSAAATCGGHHALVEELAARLAGALGTRKQRGAPPPPPPHVRELQGRRRGVADGSRALVVGVGANSGGGHGGMALGSWDGSVHHLLPGFFEPAAPLYVASCHHPPAMCQGGSGGGGTGVFLPRADQAYMNRAAAASISSPIPRNGACMHAGAKPPRTLRKEAAAMTMMIARQQQEQQLRAMAAEMEQQRQKRDAFAAAFHGGCPALAPRQQWTY